jgi:hypothetical protein
MALSKYAQEAISCLRGLKRKTKNPEKKKQIDKKIKEIKECCK